MPQITEEVPNLTNAEPLAVEMQSAKKDQSSIWGAAEVNKAQTTSQKNISELVKLSPIGSSAFFLKEKLKN